jgi:integrase
MLPIGAFAGLRTAELLRLEWRDIDPWHADASIHLAKHQDAAALALDMGHTTTAMIFANYRAA